MTKPIWVACSGKMRDYILDSFACGRSCPNSYDLEDNSNCPRDKNGDTMTCNECWLRFFDFDITDGDEHDN